MSQKAQPPEELAFGEWGSGICLGGHVCKPMLSYPPLHRSWVLLLGLCSFVHIIIILGPWLQQELFITQFSGCKLFGPHNILKIRKFT